MMAARPEWLDQAHDFLEFKDLESESPTTPPCCTLFEREGYDTHSKIASWHPGFIMSHLSVESFLVRAHDFGRCNELGLQGCREAATPFYTGEDGKTHEFGGTQVVRGIEIESIYFDHFWDGMGGKSLILPSQHLVMYLGLTQDHCDHGLRTTWTDPLDAVEVIERVDQQLAQSDRRLSIRLEYLRDYLAARRKCLSIMRWCERFVTYGKTDTLPWKDREPKKTAHGQIEFDGPRDIGLTGYPALRATLTEWFRVDQAAKARHYKLNHRPERLGAAEFVGPDGRPVRFGAHVDWFCLISLKRDVLALFDSPERPRWRVFNESPGQLWLCFPRGVSLWASDSPHGQIQVLLGDLAKLDEEYQRALAPFSEIKRGKPHREWFEAGFMCNPPEDLPWHERLHLCQQAANRCLAPLTKRNPILPGVEPLEASKLLRPGAKDDDGFFRIAKDVRRTLLDEGRIKEWFIPEACRPSTEDVGSIGALKGLMREHDNARLTLVGPALDALNRFRQVDAHSVDAEKALIETGYSTEADFACRYDRLMQSVCTALEVISDVARSVGTKLGLSIGGDSPPNKSS